MVWSNNLIQFHLLSNLLAFSNFNRQVLRIFYVCRYVMCYFTVKHYIIIFLHYLIYVMVSVLHLSVFILQLREFLGFRKFIISFSDLKKACQFSCTSPTLLSFCLILYDNFFIYIHQDFFFLPPAHTLYHRVYSFHFN